MTLPSPFHFDDDTVWMAFEGTDSHLVITDPAGIIQYANKAFLSFTGYTFEEVKHKPMSIIKSGSHDKAFYRNFWQTILAKKTYVAIFQNRKKNGENYFIKETVIPMINKEGGIRGFFSSSKDITSEVLLQRQLEIDNAFTKNVLQTIRSLVVGIDPSGKIILFNKMCEELTGYCFGKIKGRHFSVLFDKEEQDGFVHYFNELISENKVKSSFVNKLIRKDGTFLLISWSNIGIRDQAGTLLYIVATGLDISENDRIQKEIVDVNQNLQQLVEKRTSDLRLKNEELSRNKLFLEKVNEAFPALIYMMDIPTGKITFLNNKIPDSIAHIFSLEVPITAEILASTIHPEDFKKATDYLSKYNSKYISDFNEIEFRLKSRNGEYIWVLSKTSTYEFDHQNNLPLKRLGFLFDINQRKQSELRAKENKQMFSSILDNASALIVKFKIAENRQISFMNRFATDLTGYHEADFISGEKIWADLIVPGYIESLNKSIQEAVENKSTYSIQYPIITKAKQERWVEEKGKGVFDETGELNYIEGFVQDITEKKNNEDKLRRSEERLAEAHRIAHIGTWQWDLVTNELYWSDEIYVIFGLDKSLFSPSYPLFLERIAPEDRKFVEDAVAFSIAENQPYDIEHRIVLSDNSIRHVREWGKNYYSEDGKPIRMAGTVQDITDQKLLQKKYNAAYLTLENSINAVFNADPKGNVTYANQAAAKFWGYDSPDKMILEKPNVRDYWYEIGNSGGKEILSSIMEKGYYVSVEGLAVKRKDGTLVHTLVSGSALKDERNRIVGYIGVFFDITEKINIEKDLKRYDEQLRFVFSNIDEIVFAVDTTDGRVLDGKSIFLSETTERITGIKSEAFMNDQGLWFSLIHPDDWRGITESTNRMINERIPVTRMYRLRKGDSDIYIWIEEKIIPYYNSEEILIAYYGTARDVTERINSEKAVKESEEKYRSLFENALVGMFRVDFNTEIIFEANSIFMDMFGYQPNDFARSEFKVSDHFICKDNFDSIKKKLSDDILLRNHIAPLKDTDGKEFWGELSVYYDKSKGKMEGVVIDITTRLQHEKKLQENIDEKETLLKELHHRVKNNLQIVSGLIELQIGNAKSSEISAPLHESRDRIMAIALVHEKMYQSVNINDIDFAEYLRDLVHSICLLHQFDRIKTTLELKTFKVEIDKAIPLGLIAHEVFSNCFKHAFRKKKNGTITVTMKKKSGMSAGMMLSFEDDGDGFDVRQAKNSNSLGWKLIHSLAKQAKVKISISSKADSGSRIEILI
jgi:PAS domain S-box-containing protein